MNLSKITSIAFIIAGIGLATIVPGGFVKDVNAIVATFNASEFCKSGKFNYLDCVKQDFKDVREGEISCPDGQLIQNIYVHAGDGQTVYQLPHVGFEYEFSNNKNSVTVKTPTHKHDISWLGITCGEEEHICEDEEAINYEEEAICEYKETDPTCEELGNCEEEPTPTPSEPTPTPISTVKISFATVDPTCDSDVVNATIHIEDDGNNISGVRVVFRYSGEEKIAYTDNDGKANVNFDYKGDGHLETLPDGFSTHLDYIRKETNCDSPTPTTEPTQTTTTTEGQVLGASTDPQLYAEAGVVEDVMMTLMGISGAAMFATGSILNVKKRT